MQMIEGGVTAAKALRRQRQRLGSSIRTARTWRLFTVRNRAKWRAHLTTNVVKAAPVKWDRNVVDSGVKSQAVIVNSGIANACTGEEGMKYCEETANESGQGIGSRCRSVLVGSTGVIGMQLPMDRVKDGIRKLAEAKKPDLGMELRQHRRL